MADWAIYLDSNRALLRRKDSRFLRTRYRQIAVVPRENLSALLQEQCGRDGRRPHSVAVVLSSSFCIFDCLANAGKIWKQRDVVEVGRIRLREKIGPEEASRRVVAVESTWGATAMTCSVEESILEEIGAVAQHCKLKLLSIKSWLGEFLSARRSDVREQSALALFEFDCTTFAWMRGEMFCVESISLADPAAGPEALRLLISASGYTGRVLARFRLSEEVGASGKSVDESFSNLANFERVE
jgi:hypothetical protein